MLDRLKQALPERGDWVPLIPLPIRMIILILWAIEPISRGLDYITGDGPNVTQSLNAVESAFPLHVWGIFCFVSGVLILAGFAGRWKKIAITGLHLAGATYFALACGLTDTAIDRGGDGFRTPVMFFIFSLTYWCAAFGYAFIRREPVVVVDDDPEDAKVPDGTANPHD
ncbi:minor tail protein [Gordonia Phage Lollipop1437]|uniref:Uncharacterized protein n=1 Tax=Gordonia Phage Lollipop1437 TaxID=2588505 RepID=A0A4Y6EKB2_9CAUD|nr:minor tail protein [Gordonia Phage Lollipop1437]QDF19160.1 hypothetical protein SEA_LOLLIPOP1437_56 [Gordonia Phage Lollipop1437]